MTVIDSFYEAFAARDHAAMNSQYDSTATFSDPVFVDLGYREVTGMWRMFCERGEDLEITHRDVQADDNRGSALWEAHYTFTATGRHVHNIIRANFRFADGKIVEHRDDFDFYSWSRQALGPVGLLLGWSPIVRNATRRKARQQLDRFLSSSE